MVQVQVQVEANGLSFEVFSPAMSFGVFDLLWFCGCILVLWTFSNIIFCFAMLSGFPFNFSVLRNLTCRLTRFSLTYALVLFVREQIMGNSLLWKR